MTNEIISQAWPLSASFLDYVPGSLVVSVTYGLAFFLRVRQRRSHIVEERHLPDTDPELSEFTSYYYRLRCVDRAPEMLGRWICLLKNCPSAVFGILPMRYFFARIAQIKPDALRGYEVMFDNVPHRGKLFILGILRLAGDAKTRDFLNPRLHNWRFLRERRAIRLALEGDFKEAISVIQRPIKSGTDLDLLWVEFIVTGNTEPVLRVIDVLEWPDRIRQRLTLWLRSDQPEQERIVSKLRELGIFIGMEQKEVLNKTDLDLLCSRGGRQRLERIAQSLPFSLTPEDLLHIGLKAAAWWSLGANAGQHPLVLSTCQAQLAARSGPARTALDGICAAQEAQKRVGAQRDTFEESRTESHFRKALRWKPASPEALTNLNNTAAAEWKLEDAICAYREALQLQPHELDYLTNSDNRVFLLGRLDTVMTGFKKAIELLKSDNAKTLKKPCVVLADKETRDPIIGRFCRALQFPESAEAHFNLGNTLLDLHHLDLAIAAYQKAVQLKSDFKEALNNAGNVLVMTGNMDKAINSFQNALQLHPKDLDILYNLGYTLLYNGRAGEAVISFRKILELEPNDVSAHREIARAFSQEENHKAAEWHSVVASNLASKTHFERVIAYYWSILQGQPNDLDALYKLSKALARVAKCQQDESVAFFREVLERKPDHADAHYELACVLRQRGDHEAAERHFEEAQRLDPRLKPPNVPRKK
jgi:tetratricopeptide (TPR) repeat protein